MRASDLAKPTQVVLVTARWKGKDNIIALCWHTPLSFLPELYGIAVGKTRFSHNLIVQSGSFCVNFMPAELEKAALFCGSKSGRHIDKFKESGLTREECKRIDAPRISEALAWMECEVVEKMDCGDHTFFIGKVVHKEWVREGKRLFQRREGFGIL